MRKRVILPSRIIVGLEARHRNECVGCDVGIQVIVYSGRFILGYWRLARLPTVWLPRLTDLLLSHLSARIIYHDIYDFVGIFAIIHYELD